MTVAQALPTPPPVQVRAATSRQDRVRVLALVAGAVAVRLLMFAGRGDYVAFDEGWYLLLGQSLFAGTGYALSGLTHTVLSPLFPVLAGAVGVVLGDPVWAGRIVAAVAAGLLVWPCWHTFRRLAGRRTAWLACLLVVALPALAPFVAPYWIGWDLWVGAEPLLHLFLFGALALTLRARERGRARDWLAAGAVFALAYLARPEAVIALGVVGLLLAGAFLLQRNRAVAGHAVAFALAFALVASPYWLYLHDVLGRWALTGRGVELTVVARGPARATSAPPVGAAATIEHMLWAGDQTAYVQGLYALDASGRRLASAYWGVAPSNAPVAGTNPDEAAPVIVPQTAVRGPQAVPAPANGTREDVAASAPRRPSRMSYYARALARIVPWFLWPFILLGVVGARRGRQAELWVALPLVGSSVAIAAIVAADPRTQLFIVPLAAFYVARGLRTTGVLLDRSLPRRALRRGFAGGVLAAAALALLFGTQARRLYMSVAVGSPHHYVGAENRQVGSALQQLVPADGSVMSWHPAIALYARRDWRVLPHAPFADIVRYADAVDTRYIVLSPYYPGPRLLGESSREHLVVQVPHATARVQSWHLEVHRQDGPYLLGTLRPVAAVSSGAR